MIVEFYRVVVEASASALVVVECDETGQRIAYANPAVEHLTGYGAAEILGRDWRGLCTAAAWDRRWQVDAVVGEERHARLVLSSRRKDGASMLLEVHAVPVRNESGVVTQYVAALRDLTAEHAYIKRLEHRAAHDYLTGLPNRHELRDRLATAIEQATRDASQFVVLFLDLDDFKSINDRYGHDVGDELLKSVAGRLVGGARCGDTVARFGGDEFVLLLEPQGDDDSTAAIVARIRAGLRRPFQVGGYEIAVSCSIGLSSFPADGVDADALLRTADRAMYGDKRPELERKAAYREAI